MDPARRAFYQYHSSLMEPWDGPADIAFTDGKRIGAILDRNGLRPGRYYVTKDDLVVMASEAGVLDFPPENILRKGRLQPGRMFLVDTELGRIVEDEEIKAQIINERPYADWLKQHLVHLKDLPAAPEMPPPEPVALAKRQVSFGYTFEDQRILMAPMARDGNEGVGSMGNDTPLAALSQKSRMLYDYFKQLFAQVTNPPIDCIREEIITSSDVWLGSEGNLLDPRPGDCRRLELPGPVLTNEEFAKVRRMSLPGLKVGTLRILFRAERGEDGLVEAIEEMRAEARRMIEEDEVNILILSDRGVNKEFAAIPSLLAVSGLHHFLIRQGLRMKVSLALETGDAREVHHFALLIGYGCSVINPYLAFETLDGMIRDEMLPGVEHKLACKNFAKAAVKGVVKVMSKMGISAVQSYHGAQVFEAVGLRQDVIDEYFSGTASRVGGVGLDVIAREVLMRHTMAFAERKPQSQTELPSGGQYQWRSDGEFHLFNPESIHRLQKSVRTGSYATYKSYAELIDDRAKNLSTLRGLLDFKQGESVPIDEVESVESLMRRFKTGAMSYGSISKEAHETLAIAMNRVGGKSNTGEGGEDPDRYIPMENGDSKNSAIKQVASGRFGVTSHYLVNAKELQIKMAQGAKPGEGGQLPGTKVYPWIAKTRGTTAGVGLISPPPHHDIYSIEDLAELIHDLKNANRDARISVKLVAEVGVGTIAAGVAKAHADVVLISGARRRHRRIAADLADTCGPAVGVGPRRDAPDAGHQQPALAHRGRDRRPAQDRPRRRHRRLVGRRGIRFRHRAAGRGGLHHDARVPSQHLPGGCGHAGSATAREVRRQARTCRELHALRRARICARSWRSSASASSRTWWAASTCSSRAPPSITGRPRASTSATSCTRRTPAPRSGASARSARITASTGRSTSPRC